jgi:hypothetical protein
VLRGAGAGDDVGQQEVEKAVGGQDAAVQRGEVI